MKERLLIACLDDMDIIDLNIILKNRIEMSILYNFQDCLIELKTFYPDIVLIQAEEINDSIIKKLNNFIDGIGKKIDWLSIVKKNTPRNERLARINNVFYYGVGIDDLQNVYTAIEDLIQFRRFKYNKFEF